MRAGFQEDLTNLSLQVEVMALRVGRAIEGACEVARTGDARTAAAMFDADDEIDAMHTSLTEKCIELLVREQPVASDLRVVLAVMRIVDSWERIGDLALRIAHQAPEVALFARSPALAAVIDELCGNVERRFSVVSRAWSARSIDPLADLADAEPLDQFGPALMGQIAELRGTDAACVAVGAFVVGRSLDRIGDHTTVIANRIRFMFTGNASYLAAEVG